MPPTPPKPVIVRVTLAIASLCILLPFAAAGDAGDAGDASDAGDAGDAAESSRVTPNGDERQSGNASFYAKHLAGRKTASGERYDPEALTAAHRTLPMGTKLHITNPKNDRSVIVTVNDRGRLPKGRVVDVSSAAADALDMKRSGVTKVETHVVHRSAATDRPTAKAAADPDAVTDAARPR